MLKISTGRYSRSIWFSITLVLATFYVGSITLATDERIVRVMNQNMFAGSNAQAFATAKSKEELAAAVATTVKQLEASKPAERAAAMAREIARAQPDLVGLQEASILEVGTPPTVKFDLLQLLIDELVNKQRKPYKVVAEVTGFVTPPELVALFKVKFTSRDAIIARTDLPPGDLRLGPPQIGSYKNIRVTPLADGKKYSDPVGWASVDVRSRGRDFRFVTTHLDPGSLKNNIPELAHAQAQELLETAMNTPLPVVLVCDCNATADISANPSFATYKVFRDAGFVDAFKAAHPDQSGFTCCQDENLLNQESALKYRIDLVLFRGAFTVENVQVIGNSKTDRTQSGLWPSDHAGIVAALQLPQLKITKGKK
jgi:endonuclease/exonuclease/phosphatase family metal-dependent hydrolase